jgi:hypothetical protein
MVKKEFTEFIITLPAQPVKKTNSKNSTVDEEISNRLGSVLFLFCTGAGENQYNKRYF